MSRAKKLPWELDETRIGFRFSGGIANDGKLNFYEAGRYRYAAARLLYTIEHFRKTGIVLERLNKPIDADFTISAPSEGSYLEIVQYVAPIISDPSTVYALSNIPFDKIFPWVLDRIIPTSSTNERLADIAEKQISVIEKQLELQGQMLSAQQGMAAEREKTVRLQTEQDTEKLRIMASLARRDGDGLRENLNAATQLSDIVAKYGHGPEKDPDPDMNSAYIAHELSAEVKRAKLLSDVQDVLDEIPNFSENKIVERVRKIVPDLGFPLRRSSDMFNIEVGNDNDLIASLNLNRIKQMTSVVRDDNGIRVVGNMTRLDKDFGFGRFRPAGSRSALSFVIPKEVYFPNRQKFVDAFGVSEITVHALPYRDGIGNISRLVILEVL